MPLPECDKIWFNGELVDWHDAKIHVLSHVVHYGSSVFEGIRCYKTEKGSAVFRLDEHVSRLFDSAKIYRMEIPYTQEEVTQAILETIRVNKLEACYIRPVVFRGYETLGVDPMGCPVDVVIAVWEWGEYLGEAALKNGVSVCTSSWNRMAPNTLPFLAKAGGNYLNSQLVRIEANMNGYDEGIVLGTDGLVSEGSGENIFAIKNGSIVTPESHYGILPGITRHTAITLMRDLGMKVEQRGIPREFLYIADEVFFTGTAAEITPIRAIDKIQIGAGERGPITAQIQDAFFKVIRAEVEDEHGWLTFV
ncbi:MAG: branched-chain amino acid transaminase [Gemmatimonadetes bacterium]|jgi:branched-chain amino acid aminotransferase|nr:branched-chain amino acid transaminase [Gemmatimonadota bacterium]MDE0962924.1 branched-chain amino acid transaminase [Candidatus Latescibacterota bacterium]MBT5328558.1 branched-chain amino acid transaminase [Gemmatimonadota bacterium]MBT5452961.1 branched-chain amino acid transaminase [Gemmatimonadota bacterium]MBT5803162.1 branched-chain amino acid transaminase [Gemmatimonadota bacterium]